MTDLVSLAIQFYNNKVVIKVLLYTGSINSGNQVTIIYYNRISTIMKDRVIMMLQYKRESEVSGFMSDNLKLS